MKPVDLALILASVLLSATAQLLLKLGASSAQVRGALAGGAALERIGALITAPMLMAGLVVYGLSAAFWIAVLARVDLSLAYPFVGLGFILTFAMGALVLGESASVARLAGTLMIATGAVLVARSA